MALDLTALTAEVAKNTDVEGSTKVLIGKLADEIATLNANNGDPTTQAKIDALVATLRANDSDLAAAVAANTPPAPPVVDPVPPVVQEP